MSVTLGLTPAEVERYGDEDPALLAALRRAVEDRWTTETELLAGIYELTHQNMRLLASIAGAKRDDIPAAVRIPRPGQTQSTRKTASPAELRRWMQQRRGGTR